MDDLKQIQSALRELAKQVFPLERELDDGRVQSGGLTKRELFAAMAMQGLLHGVNHDDWSGTFIAEQAVFQADALIAELAKEVPDA